MFQLTNKRALLWLVLIFFVCSFLGGLVTAAVLAYNTTTQAPEWVYYCPNNVDVIYLYKQAAPCVADSARLMVTTKNL